MDHFPSRRELAAFSLSWRQRILASSGLLSEDEVAQLAAHLNAVALFLEAQEEPDATDGRTFQWCRQCGVRIGANPNDRLCGNCQYQLAVAMRALWERGQK
jgi:hypothetical protein